MPHREKHSHREQDLRKGAVEQGQPQQKTNVSLTGQNPHRDQDPLLASSDTDFPEPGENEEHTGEPYAQDQLNPEGLTQDQDPGFRQKENQNKEKGRPAGGLTSRDSTAMLLQRFSFLAWQASTTLVGSTASSSSCISVTLPFLSIR